MDLDLLYSLQLLSPPPDRTNLLKYKPVMRINCQAKKKASSNREEEKLEQDANSSAPKHHPAAFPPGCQMVFGHVGTTPQKPLMHRLIHLPTPICTKPQGLDWVCCSARPVPAETGKMLARQNTICLSQITLRRYNPQPSQSCRTLNLAGPHSHAAEHHW